MVITNVIMIFKSTLPKYPDSRVINLNLPKMFSTMDFHRLL